MTVAKRIDGKAKAAELAESITKETASLLADHGIKPGLAVVIIGEDPASQVYVRNKKRTAESCGFHSVQQTVAEDVSQSDVLELIDKLNNDDAIHGILVQLPLPGHLDEQVITQAIDPSKVLGRWNVHHPSFTTGTVAAARRHDEIDGAQGVHFCGAYWRYGFHEDGVWSGLRAAERLQSAARAEVSRV